MIIRAVCERKDELVSAVRSRRAQHYDTLGSEAKRHVIDCLEGVLQDMFFGPTRTHDIQ